MNAISFARTCKQSNVYVLLSFAKYLNFALFAEVQPIAIVVRSSTTHSVTIRSKHQCFFEKITLQNGFFSLELLATLMKTGSNSDNVPVRAPLPEPFLDTNTMWKHKTNEKQHKNRKFALLKFFNDLN